MIESKHTSGPWIQSASLIYARGDKGGNICVMSELRASRFIQYDKLEINSKDWDEQMANGQLIAAAPDLLAACEAALAYFEQCVMSCDPEEEDIKESAILRAAIAKAKGETR